MHPSVIWNVKNHNYRRIYKICQIFTFYIATILIVSSFVNFCFLSLLSELYIFADFDRVWFCTFCLLGLFHDFFVIIIFDIIIFVIIVIICYYSHREDIKSLQQCYTDNRTEIKELNDEKETLLNSQERATQALLKLIR